ncbi:MAG: HAD-IB family phosphatase [Chloroflexota bacterium]
MPISGNGNTTDSPEKTRAVADAGTVVVSDFDGTITEEDVCLALLDLYADDGWQQLEADFEAGRVTLEACLIGQVATFREPRSKLVDYALEQGRLRQGFGEFVAFCRERGIPFMVASAGLDFYIEAILAREGLGDLDVTCITTSPLEHHVVLNLPLAGFKDLRNLGDFKELIVREQQARGKRAVFVGDGSTDFAAARAADVVFARAKLLAYCRREGIDCTPFATFDEVRLALDALIAVPQGNG